jgi:hypothetical protein
MRTEPSLAEVVSVFIAQARDKYGLGRFMPDELPLLDEMARLARIDLDRQARREHLEAERLDRKHIGGPHRLEFTVRPTPPSGPEPKS